MEEVQKKLLLRLTICALANVVLLGAIIFLGYISLGNFIVYRNILSNVFVVVLAGLVICALWILAYVHLDALQKEPLKNIILVFAFAVVLQFFFEALLGFVATNPYVSLSGANRDLFNFVTNALSSLLAIACVFKFLVFNFKDFDEAVDALIYGGIAGVGIAFSDTLTSIFVFQSASFDFVLLNFTVRISLFSCAAALAGFLLYDAMQGKRNFAKTLLAYAIIILVFGVSAIVETKFSQGMFIQPHNRTLVAFGRTAIFCIVVFAAIVALIFVQLKKEFVAVENKLCLADLIVAVLILALAVFTRIAPDKNEKFVSQNAGNKNYSFELPYGFTEYKGKSVLSLFASNDQDGLRYMNKRINDAEVKLNFGAKFDSEIEQKSKWSIVSDSWEKQDDRYIYKFFTANSADTMEVEVSMSKNDDAYANKIVKTLLKTLEAE